MTGFAALRELDDAALRRAIVELYAPGAVEPDVAALCRALAGRALTVAVPGGAVEVDLGDWTSIIMIRLGGWEPHLAGLAAALVGPGAVAIDVGAHVGTWTLLLAARVGPGGRVIAFEPYPPSAARARAAVIGAGVGDRVRVIEAAVGDRGGRAPLYGGADPMLRSLVADDGAAGAASAAGASDDVAVTTLDAVMAPDGPDGLDVLDAPVDFVKIDSEGLELAVLRGGRRLLARGAPAILIELHVEQLARHGGSLAELLAELDRQGFTAFDLRPDGDALRVEALRGPPTTHHLLARRDPRPFTVGLRPPP